MSHHIEVDFAHPANRPLIAYLEDQWPGRRFALNIDPVPSPFPVSLSPSQVKDPYYDLGTHPDLVEWLWDKMTELLPRDCRWVLYGRPVLIHPQTGIIFGLALGTHINALRLAPDAYREGLESGLKTQHTFSEGTTISCEDWGPGWIMGDWDEATILRCELAYQFASADDT